MRLESWLKKGAAVSCILIAWMGSIYGIFKVFLRLTEHAKRREKRFRLYYLLENEWLKLHNNGYKLEEYFIRHQFYKIAVYGMDNIGNRVQEELNQSEKVEIAYMIDEEAYHKYGTGIIVDFEDNWEDVDIILVTDEFYYPEIKAKIQEKGGWNVISLKDVILEILQYK
ncbi:MAG: hypothetical protein K1W24_01055 [Lachnospiraceae bacterium]